MIEKEPKRKKNINRVVSVLEGVTLALDGDDVVVKGEKGEVRRPLYDPRIEIAVNDNKIEITSRVQTKREKKVIGTFAKHIQNMMKGVSEGHRYKLKICSGHFPMNVSYQNNEIQIKNFLGEKTPRKLTLASEAKVTIADGEIVIESNSKEIAGQAAASIEKMTRVTNRDRRIFQDGIYIIEKDGKAM